MLGCERQTRGGADVKMFNATALPAKLLATPDVEGDFGIGAILAKATFRFDDRGTVEAETQTPVPLFEQDVQTPLGVLPADVMGRRGERFEVMLLGCAHVPVRGGACSLRVGLSVGSERREMAVFGDRLWESAPDGAGRIGAASPFTSMPLVYERAYGGSFPVQLDRESVLDVFDPVNKRGLGFDAERWAASLGQALGAPQGYPALPGYRRSLPNLEHPNALIRQWADAPEPVGWAPVPLDTAISQLPIVRREVQRLARAGGDEDPQRRRDAVVNTPDPDRDVDQGSYRAHPDWIIELPPEGARVRLDNLMSEAPKVEFALPALRLIADYVIYDRQGSRALRPHALVLLPEHRVF